MTAIPSFSCPLCQSPRPQPIPARQRRYFHCTRCDLIAVPPNDHLDDHTEKARYRLHRNTADDPGYRAIFDGPLACLARHAPRAGRVLDYGCGWAPIFVERLRACGYDATGYDRFFAPTLPATPPFDAVTCIETAEHFRSPRNAFDHIASLRAPRGCIVVRTQLHRGAASIDDWWYARDPTHVAFYSRAVFEWIAGRLSLRLVECSDDGVVCFA